MTVKNMSKKILIAGTGKGKKENMPLYKSFNERRFENADLKIKENNSQSLQKVYNNFLAYARDNGYNYLILMHDDVYINCDDLEHRIYKSGEKYPVFGLAGTNTCRLDGHGLWHLMGDQSNLRGCVAHGNPEKYHYTSFGPIPDRVILIDGVFIGINLDKFSDKVKWDETYPSRFHFYDLDFCLECNHNKVALGVVDIPIIHESPGLTNPNEEFFRGKEYFRNKWNNR